MAERLTKTTTFDEFAHGVLQVNAIQLEQERQKSNERMEEMQVCAELSRGQGQ